MHKKQKGFTLIELIIVISIIGILFTLSGSFFTSSNNEKYYAETCANYLYGEMQTFHYNALVGKTIKTGSNATKYRTTIEQNKIEFSYQKEKGETFTEVSKFTFTEQKSKKCSSDVYKIQTDITQGKNLQLTETKNFSTNTNKPASILTDKDGEKHTGSFTIQMIKDEEIIEIMQIKIDTRNQSITKHRCRISKKGTCKEREK